MNKLLAAGIFGILAGGLACTVQAQTGPTTEIATAHAHALMAQSAKTVAEAHAHLHHVINCLVGPKGTGFDAAAGNPCKGQGDGAIPASAGNAMAQDKLKTALADAKRGLRSTALAGAQADAAKAAAKLQASPAR
jgi:hypothetical protein